MKQAAVIRTSSCKKNREIKLTMSMPEIFETAGSDIGNPQKMNNYSKD